MPINKKLLQQIAAVKQREFEHEQRTAFVRNLVAYPLLIVAGSLLIMILAGPVFDPILNLFGMSSIWTEKSGVYADCSLPENRNNRFCSGKMLETEQHWNTLRNTTGGRYVPFNLND